MMKKFSMLILAGSLVLSVMAEAAVTRPRVSHKKDLVRTEELTEGRNEDTRMWENVYTVQELDEAGNPHGDVKTVREKFYEVGTGINYNTAAHGQNPVWEKTDTKIKPSQGNNFSHAMETANYRARFAPYQSHYLVEYEVDAESLELEIGDLVCYDPETGQQQTISTKAHTCVPLVDGNRIVYPNVYPGMDLEFVCETSALSVIPSFVVEKRE